MFNVFWPYCLIQSKSTLHFLFVSGTHLTPFMASRFCRTHVPYIVCATSYIMKFVPNIPGCVVGLILLGHHRRVTCLLLQSVFRRWKDILWIMSSAVKYRILLVPQLKYTAYDFSYSLFYAASIGCEFLDSSPLSFAEWLYKDFSYIPRTW